MVPRVAEVARHGRERGEGKFRDGFWKARGAAPGRPVTENPTMAKATQKITLSQSQNIPFDKLALSQQNVRRVKAGVSIDELAADIAHRGLVSSLNVRPVLDEGGKETGAYKVPAGGRRFRAIELLVKQKKLAKTAAVPCIVSSATTSEEEDSLAENVHREQLHPLDQFRTFRTLHDQGLDIEGIAARFVVTPTVVKQRLKLAAVSPKLLDLYEKDEIRLDQIMALTVSDDHSRQEQVWDRVSKAPMQEPYYIKRLLTETAVRAGDRRAVYVGAEAYEAAGGVIMRDLFEQNGGGYFEDAALLEQLVLEKLKVDAEQIRAEGWKWVETAIDFPYGHASHMGRIYGDPAEMTAEELARHDALKADYDKLDVEYAEATDYDQEIENKLDELGDAIDAFNDRPEIYDAEEMARAGVFVTLGRDGNLEIERGFVRPEDEPAAEETANGQDDEDDVRQDGHGDDGPVGGVSINGKPLDGAGEDEEETTIRPLTDRLVFELTAQRTLALRNALAVNPEIALLAMLHALVLQLFYRSASEACLEVSLKSNSFQQAHGLADTPWAKEIAERHDGWGRDLPKNQNDLWNFLIGLDADSRHALLAHCVSLSVNAAIEPWNRRRGALDHVDDLARSLDFDMVSAGWTPTVDNYLGRVTKVRILEAVREAAGEDTAQLIDHLKKPDMAREAARLLEGSDWLPEPLRRADDAPAPADDDAFSNDDEQPSELPAYLAEDAGQIVEASE